LDKLATLRGSLTSVKKANEGVAIRARGVVHKFVECVVCLLKSCHAHRGTLDGSSILQIEAQRHLHVIQSNTGHGVAGCVWGSSICCKRGRAKTDERQTGQNMSNCSQRKGPAQVWRTPTHLPKPHHHTSRGLAYLRCKPMTTKTHQQFSMQCQE
jgi:hypothetical protein